MRFEAGACFWKMRGIFLRAAPRHAGPHLVCHADEVELTLFASVHHLDFRIRTGVDTVVELWIVLARAELSLEVPETSLIEAFGEVEKSPIHVARRRVPNFDPPFKNRDLLAGRTRSARISNETIQLSLKAPLLLVHGRFRSRATPHAGGAQNERRRHGHHSSSRRSQSATLCCESRTAPVVDHVAV